MAARAYSGNSAPIRTPRGAEYEVFARVTHGLTSAIRDQKPGLAAMAEALHENQRLWTVLAADVVEPGNGLPEALRGRLFYLAEFTRQHSRKVLSGAARADILVEINTAVMRGLRGEGLSA